MFPLLYLKEAFLSFADVTIFQNLELYLYPGDRVCLIGKNGAGKSSLLKIFSRDYEIDKGQFYVLPSARIGYLKQDAKVNQTSSVYEYVLSAITSDPENNQYLADIVLENLKLDPQKQLSELSGGQLRRANLARALVEQPEILLLDEPTNHLDIESIEWLESYINNYKGAVIIISHDRRFLENTTNKIWWLDRAQMRVNEQGFKNFDTWQEQVFSEEEKQLEKLKKQLGAEEHWLTYGVTARRKRNQKRLADLHSLRNKLKEQKSHLAKGNKELNIDSVSLSRKSQFIIELDNVTFGFGDKKLINNFSLKIHKGEKIGLIGPNGAGKSSLINLITGKYQPQLGTIKRGVGLEISHFDQHKTDIVLDKSLWENLCPDGGDQVGLPDGSFQHVSSYLKKFLFESKQLKAKASTLSGGEQSRLMLAKILTNPGNFLVLDEPTNDLDMDTLEVLLEILMEFDGTVLIVSHDRDFLDKLVTRSFIFKGDGKIDEFIGSYDEYITQQVKTVKAAPIKKVEAEAPKVRTNSGLSFKYKHKLKTIPEELEKLGKEKLELEQTLADPSLYSRNPDLFNKSTMKLEQIKEQIDNLEIELLEIMEMEENLGKTASN